MPKGPHEQRLDTYVDGGSVPTIRHSAQVWTHGQQVLERMATALDTVRPQLMEKFGPQTGPAAAKAFEKVAKNVRDQAAEMGGASGALTTAGDALQDAQTTQQRLGNAPAGPPPDATQKAGETTEAFHLRQRDVSAAQHHYATVSAQREQESQQATSAVDTKYTHAIGVLESIHGQPARTDGGGGGTGGASLPGGSVPTRASAGGASGTHWRTATGGGDVPGGTDTSGGNPGGHDTGGDTDTGGNVFAPPTYGDPGIPQGPGYADPGAPTQPGGGVPFGPGGQVPLGPSATSTAIGSLLSGGIVGGTTGLSNVMRTGAMSTLTAEEQAALATSRASGTSGAAAARAGAVGMTGSSRGAARGGPGVGGGGRGDRGKKRRRPADTAFFEDDEDWLDDDEASPGVLE